MTDYEESSWLFDTSVQKYVQGMYFDSIMMCDKALESEPNDEEFLYLKAMSLAELEKYDEAEKIIDSEPCANPEMASYMAQKGFIYAMTGKPKKAREWLEKARKRNPYDFLVKIYAAYSYERIGDDVKALAAATEALKKEPQSCDMLNIKRNCLNRMGKTDEAVGFWDKALKVKYSSSKTVKIDALNGTGELELRLCGDGIIGKPVDSIGRKKKPKNIKVDEDAMFLYMKSLGFIINEKHGEYEYIFKRSKRA